MNVKQWLNRARNIDREIDQLLKQKEDTYDRILKVTASYDGETITGTRDPHKFDSVIALEAEIDRKIDNLVAVKKEILSAIYEVKDGNLREVLFLRYIQGLTFEQIAVNLHYSWRWTCTLHGRALLKMEGILNDRRM